MVLHPGVQARAQAEIDAVVGDGRLPELGDRESLPYLNCMMRELLRWRLVLPMSKFFIYINSTAIRFIQTTLGIFHACSKDDGYKGYRTPKGAIV